MPRSLASSAEPATTRSVSTMPVLTRSRKVSATSSTKASPPLMPAAKLRPAEPSTTTVPFVMYSHALSPTPSMTASAPLLRTAKRSPPRPAAKKRPPVAP